MAIGRTFRESLQKAFRSLEVGLCGFEPKKTASRNLDMTKIRFATAFRLLKIKEAFLQGYNIEEIYNLTKIDPWFLQQINVLATFNMENDNPQNLKFLKHLLLIM